MPGRYQAPAALRSRDAPLTTIEIRRDTCTDGKSSKKKLGRCFRFDVQSQFPAFCKVGEGRINGTKFSTIAVDALVPASGFFKRELKAPPPPPGAAPATIETTLRVRFSGSKITGTASFRSTDGPIPSDP